MKVCRPDKNLRTIVYCYGLKYSSDLASDWDFLWSAFENTTLSTEQVTILAALGCPSNKTVLDQYVFHLVQSRDNCQIVISLQVLEQNFNR